MKRSQVLITIILLLVATNLYLLWQMYSHQPAEEPKLPRNERLKAWAQKEFGFDSSQAEQYLALRNLRDSLLVPANAQLREAKMQMIPLKSNPDANDSMALAVVKNIGEKQAAVELVFLAHFRRLNAICTPEQRSRLDSVLARVIRRNTGGSSDSTQSKAN